MDRESITRSQAKDYLRDLGRIASLLARVRVERVHERADRWFVSPASAAKESQSFLCPCDQAIALMLDPPPSTLPMCRGTERPFT